MIDSADFLKILPDLAKAIPQNGVVTVLTGAGVSAESGIPTFREARTGLWEKYDPAELATMEAFLNNPKLVWAWYQWRRELVSKAIPNPGHLALSALEQHLNQDTEKFVLITQNVDSLHHRAGSKNIIELHGNIMREVCLDCYQKTNSPTSMSPDGEIPRCSNCGGLIRPDVVWFGEQLPQKSLDLAWQAARNCDIFLSVGTSAIVQPAASLPMIAYQNEAIIIEVNINQTPLSPYVDFVLQGFSSIVLPKLISRVWNIKMISFSKNDEK